MATYELDATEQTLVRLALHNRVTHLIEILGTPDHPQPHEYINPTDHWAPEELRMTLDALTKFGGPNYVMQFYYP